MLRNVIIGLQLATDKAFPESKFGYLLDQPANCVELFFDGLRAAGYAHFVDAVLDKAVVDKTNPP